MTSSQPVNLASVPSVYATQPSARVSERYGFIPTTAVVHALEREGFIAVQARAARVSAERTAFARHLIRFRHRDHLETRVGDWLPEVVVVNSHDGSSSYQIMAGVYRLVCSNGLVVGNSFAEVRVRHTKNAPDEIVDASFRVIHALPAINESVQAMRAVHLELQQRAVFASEALRLRYPEQAPIRAIQLLQARRADDTGSDLWTTFNVTQANLVRGGLQHERSSRRTHRISGVTRDLELNQGLWRIASRWMHPGG
jgi:Domain of unknown function (DUF932)